MNDVPSTQKGIEEEQVLFLTVHSVGTSSQPRYMIADQFLRVYTSEGIFDPDRRNGVLYHCDIEAATMIEQIVMAMYPRKGVARYVVPVEIEIYSDEPVSIEKVREWCYKSAILTLDPARTGIGPDSRSTGKLGITWSQMLQVQEWKGVK